MTEPLNGQPRPVDPPALTPTTTKYTQKGCLDWSWPLAVAVVAVVAAWAVVGVANAQSRSKRNHDVVNACGDRPVDEIEDCLVAFRDGFERD